MATFLLNGIQTAAAIIKTTYLYMAIGHDATAENLSQDGCLAEDMRVASTNSTITTTQTNDTSQHIGNFTVSVATIAMTEAAVMTIVSGGHGAARSKFNVVNLIQNDTVALTFKFVVS